MILGARLLSGGSCPEFALKSCFALAKRLVFGRPLR